MLVNLYIVTNDINNKVYIGQTSETLKRRWRKHIGDALHRDGNTNKFHNALINLGINHFKMELIGQFDVSIIDEKEIEYIAKYDSYYNGYNSTLGGGLGLRIPVETREYIVDLYRNGYSRVEIAEEVGCGPSKVTDILLGYGIQPDFERNEPIAVIMYDKFFNIQAEFDSKNEAYLFISLTENQKCDKQGFFGHIKKSFDIGCIRYKHRWQLASDLVYDDKIFRTKFDKEAYIQGKPAYQPEGKKYYVVDGALDKFLNKSYKYRKSVLKSEGQNLVSISHCNVCGRKLKGRSLTGMCNSCSNVEAKGKVAKPSKEQLINELKYLNVKQIAEKYGRTSSTVSTWIKNYGIR